MKRSTKVALWVLVPSLAVAGLGVATHVRAKRALEHLKAQLRSQGEKLSIAEITIQATPDEAGAARELKFVAGRLGNMEYDLSPGAMRFVKPGRVRVSWRESNLPSPAGDKSTNIWPELQAAVEDREETMAEIRRILAERNFRFTHDYSTGFEGLILDHMTKLRLAAQWFSAETLLRLHLNHPDRAFENLRAMIRIAVKYQSEPLMIDHLVRIAMESMAAGATWQALQYNGWSEEQLSEMQRLWDAITPMRLVPEMLATERVCAMQEFDRARRSPDRFNQLLNFSAGSSTATEDLGELAQQLSEDPKEGFEKLIDRFPRRWVWRWWISYDEEAWFLRYAQLQIDAARRVTNAAVLRPVLMELAEKSKPYEEPPRGYLLTRASGVSNYENFLRKAATAETQRRIVVAAIALRRFEKRQGKLPAGLASLVPEFLRAMPLDPMDGQPLRYRVLGGGQFLLYSVGLNGTDEGGDPKPLREDSTSYYWTTGKDWVWPLPASVEEVREFNAAQEKKRRR